MIKATLARNRKT